MASAGFAAPAPGLSGSHRSARAIGIETEPKVRVAPALRRRPSYHQGRALEVLGHAIEYLADDCLYGSGGADGRATAEAMRLLMSLSREVFAECPVVVPLGERMRRRVLGWLGVPASEPQA